MGGSIHMFMRRPRFPVPRARQAKIDADCCRLFYTQDAMRRRACADASASRPFAQTQRRGPPGLCRVQLLARRPCHSRLTTEPAVHLPPHRHEVFGAARPAGSAIGFLEHVLIWADR